MKINKGFSLVEILLVMSIIMALMITGFLLYPKLVSDYNVNVEVSNAKAMQAEIRKLYRSSPDYTGISDGVVREAKIVPESMVINKTGAIITKFKGELSFLPSDVSISNTVNSSFTMKYRNVNPRECIKLILDLAPNFYEININTYSKVKSPTFINNPHLVNREALYLYCNSSNVISEINFISL